MNPAAGTRWTRLRSSLATAVGILVVAALLLVAAVWNRYPLVYPDTGTYVHSSFTWRVPSDRPVFYGLFLAVTHVGRAPWISVVAQAGIVAVLLVLLLRVVAPGRGVTTTVLMAAGLTAATSLPWFVGQLSPDVFAGVGVVSLYLLVAGEERLGRAARAFAFVCLVVSAMVHSSHLLLAVILAGILQLLRPDAARGRGLRDVWKAIGVAVVASLVGNLVLSGKPVLSRGSHAFLMGRLIEDGIMGSVLDARCPTTPYRLCAFRAELPMSADEYLWKPNSVLQRTGGFGGSKAESSRLILAAAVTHPVRVVQGGLVAWARQLVRFRTGDGLGPPEGGRWVDTVIAERFPDEAARYRGARQQQGTLAFDDLVTFHQWVAIAAVVLLIAVAVADLRTAPKVRSSLALFVALALVVNALVTGALSGPHDRYQSRLMWLVVLTAAVAVVERLDDRRSKRATPGTSR